jgi:hypothetical protein
MVKYSFRLLDKYLNSDYLQNRQVDSPLSLEQKLCYISEKEFLYVCNVMCETVSKDD